MNFVLSNGFSILLIIALVGAVAYAVIDEIIKKKKARKENK